MSDDQFNVQDQQTSSFFVSNQSKNSSKHALLSTALIKVRTPSGVHILRALIDSGSQGSFITERAVQRLHLFKTKISANVTGLGCTQTAISTGQVSLKVYSMYNDKFALDVRSLVLKSVSGYLPPHTIRISPLWTHIEDLPLADPSFHTAGRIDVLLGIDVYARILLPGLRKGPPDTPIAQHTVLGWILFGTTHHTNQSNDSGNIVSFHNCVEVEELLKRFWELEEAEETKSLTAEEHKCERFFEETYKRLADGRFEVRLPFSQSNIKLGRSRNLAISRLLQMERKLSTNQDLYSQYVKCLNEYIDLGHMNRSNSLENVYQYVNSSDEECYNCYYLPHHAVLKESSTTKLRVVFNASQRTSNGKALNDFLLIGPKLQNNLNTILLRWRRHKIVFTADIKQMYRQIRVSKQDSNYQRIVWRTHPAEEIQDYNLNTVSFGVNCAPYIAIKCLRKLAQLEAEIYPEASNVILNDFYVDDVLSGADTVADALKLQNQLIKILHSACFDLRKWASNHDCLLEHIPREHRELHLPLTVNRNESVKTLGLFWHPADDVFSYKVSLPSTHDFLSKRLLLSEIAKIFDPIGFLTPIIIFAKILMQKLWVHGLHWDDILPHDIRQDWQRFKVELNALERLRIPRWLGVSQFGKRFEIHGFCDASTKAYAACVYLRTQDEDNNITVRLITSKSKVAPLKSITLPRLELCGASLLANLLVHTEKSFNIPNTPVFAWTDSTIVLAWIHGEHTKWKVFVSNRVIQIQERVNSSNWRHIDSASNPADCASRGIFPTELLEHELWWQGPPFLHHKQSTWANPTDNPFDDYGTSEEMKKVATYMATVLVKSPLLNINDYSSLNRLTRITAYCFRFIKNCRLGKPNRKTGYLKTSELRAALEFWIKDVQSHEFSEFPILRQNHQLPSASHLLKLSPFLSNDGLLRVGGRLHNALIPYQEKHPILLPKNHHFTNLIINQAHHDTLHGGQQLVTAHLRKQYWIINARAVVRRVLHKCIICFRFRATTASQIMGNLPQPRLVPSRAFTHTGIDYAGPINLRVSKGRGHKTYKGYLAIFICLSTKAIHLEAVSDQSAPAFIAAFRRFIARRGICSHVYTDCGTNFIGAKNILDMDLQQSLKEIHEKTADAFTVKGIEWHFIPPASPHFGGLWEAGVKSTKYHLKRILGNSNLTYEELSTVLAQIEACLNSRPLCPMSSDPTDMSALTPGHFLVGDSLLAHPEPDISDGKPHLLTRWQYIQQLTQNFWKRWSMEYMTRLQERPKWARQYPNIEIGNLVLVKDSRQPPTRWQLARVIATHPGSDGFTRVVTIQTTSATLKRPIAKLCVLPILDNDNNQILKNQ